VGEGEAWTLGEGEAVGIAVGVGEAEGEVVGFKVGAGVVSGMEIGGAATFPKNKAARKMDAKSAEVVINTARGL
jgi:hypothetical protein